MSDDKRLKEFVTTYRLSHLEEKLISEGITVDFLLSQNPASVKSIAQELSPKVIQQKKLCFAVAKLKKAELAKKISNPSIIIPKSISLSDLNLLPPESIKPAIKRQKSDRIEECPICYESPFILPLTTPCNHTFCRDCIKEALEIHTTCPMCLKALEWKDMTGAGKDIETHRLKSNILSKIECTKLQKMVDDHLKYDGDYKLLYQASRDGFVDSDFFNKCHMESNTFCIIHTDSNNVFGGFTTKKWDRNVKGWREITDKHAFLYLIRSNQKYPTQIFSVEPNGIGAIGHQAGYFLMFGKGANGIYLSKNCHLNNASCVRSKCVSYPSLPEKHYLNGGKDAFKVRDVEVFQLDIPVDEEQKLFRTNTIKRLESMGFAKNYIEIAMNMYPNEDNLERITETVITLQEEVNVYENGAGDMFEATFNYHGVTIQNNVISNGGQSLWATIFGKLVIRKNQIFSWNFVIAEQPANISNTWKLVIGVVPASFKKTTDASYTFVAPNYGFIGSEGATSAIGKKTSNYQKFGENAGDKLKMKLDLKHHTLTFVVNGVIVKKNKQICIKKLKSTEYRMAISICAGRKLKLVSSGFE